MESFNKCFDEEISPDELELAEVVTLYEKGNVQNPANDRPISLLQTLSKIYAAMIQPGLADTIDK